MFLTFLARPAHAYRTLADLDDFGATERVRWEQNPVVFHFTGTYPRGLSERQFDLAIEEALSAWRYFECSEQDFRYGGVDGNTPQSGDGINSVSFVETGWLDKGFDPDASGFTDLLVKRRDGEWRIEEADIYINADAFRWGWADVLEPGQRNVQAVLLHELGHAMGLAHPCELDGAPSCKNAGDARHSAMYPAYDDDNTLTPSNDDVAGFCYLYEGVCSGPNCPIGRVTSELEPEPPTDAPVCELASGTNECSEASDEGRSLLGDPCTTSRACSTGVCSRDGYCVEQCEQDTDCQFEATCERAMLSARGCTLASLPLGAPCTESAECLGSWCLEDSPQGDVCTRVCDDWAVKCPLGWACESVEGERVCIPDDANAKCSVRSPGWPVSRFESLGLTGVFCLVLWGWRKARTKTDRS